MLAEITASLFQAFITGSLAVLVGGFAFEGGKRYVKTGRSNEFTGKIRALPFFLFTLIVGFILQAVLPFVDSIATAPQVLTRIGIIGFATMILFNYSVPNFNYTDVKSLLVYAISLVIGIYPFTGLSI